MKPGKTGLARVIAAAFYSLQGLKSCLKNEAAFRQEVVLFLLLLPLLIYLPVSGILKLMLLAVNMLVLIVELLNSAIESVVDMVSPEYHDLAGRAKDMGSGAVFLSLIIATVFWVYAACTLIFL